MSSCQTCDSARPQAADDASFPLQACPSRMSDGRSFTNYASSKCTFSASKYGSSSYDSRQWMIHNADDVIKQQRMDSMQSVCVPPPGLVPVPKEEFVVRCTPQTCTRTNAAGFTAQGLPLGLGDGRRY